MNQAMGIVNDDDYFLELDSAEERDPVYDD